MEFYDVINKRRTVREFLDKEVDFEAIRRILEAGNEAPTWNHNRNWSFIILRTDEEKEYAFEHVKKIADKFDAEKYLSRPQSYPTTLGQKMYAHAMPRQFTMLKVPPTYMIPVFIGIGYADPTEQEPERSTAELDKQIHYGRWK